MTVVVGLNMCIKLSSLKILSMIITHDNIEVSQPIFLTMVIFFDVAFLKNPWRN